VDVLNGRRDDSLVFDAAGKCILTLYSPDDIVPLPGHTEPSGVGKASSSKGKTKYVPRTAVNLKKRRRVVVDEEDEDEDEDDRLLDWRPSKRKAPDVPDQSLEGTCSIF
jgi:hypothetical protein